jgi:hypothetical protein
MNSLGTKIKNAWGWVLLVVGSVLVLLKMKSKYDSALSKEKNFDALLKDNDLKSDLKHNSNKLLDLEAAKQKKLKEAKDKKIKEVEDFYNGKK